MVATFDDRPSHDSGGSGSGDGGSSGNDTGVNEQDDGSAQGVYPNGCPGHAGPEPVKAMGFCIDSTEVTNAQYAQFVDAKKGNAGGQSASCAWNATYVPESGWPVDSSKASLPVVEVDWCDAQAFCAWAGKRLCGKVGGGASTPDDAARISDQWFLACSAAGTRAYPYPGSYADDNCNGDDHGIKKAIAVGTMPKCEGGFGGLFDMSGNVAEWEDACTGSAGAGDQCLLRGGAYESSESKLGCATAAADARSGAHADVGFRCCSSP
ncbi:MAG: uncharacterized protein JWM74_1749 [Myxococcaceae bacterium]|nr:uncharacterized protein [Myxococcaceae bacterium]